MDPALTSHRQLHLQAMYLQPLQHRSIGWIGCQHVDVWTLTIYATFVPWKFARRLLSVPGGKLPGPQANQLLRHNHTPPQAFAASPSNIDGTICCTGFQHRQSTLQSTTWVKGTIVKIWLYPTELATEASPAFAGPGISPGGMHGRNWDNINLSQIVCEIAANTAKMAQHGPSQSPKRHHSATR